MDANVVAFNTGTSTGTLAIPVGFQTKAAIWWGNGLTGTTDTQGTGNGNRFVGFTAGTGTTGLNRCMVNQSENGQQRADADRYDHTSKCLVTLDTDGAVSGLAHVSTIGSTSITFARTDAFPSDYRFLGLPLGSTELTNAASGRFTAATTGGTQTVTGVGFQPDAVFLTSISDTATGTRVNDALHSFGVGVTTTTGGTRQAVVAGGNEHNAQTMVTKRYITNAHCVALIADNAASIEGTASYAGATTDGFQLSWANAPNNADGITYLAIKGGSWNILDGSMGSTVGATVALSGAGFQPDGGLVVSTELGVESTTGSLSNVDTWNVGAFTSTTNRAALAYRDAHNQATASIARRREQDAVFCGALTSGSNETMDVQSIDSDGVTFVMDGGSAQTAYFWTVLFGPPSGVVTRTVAASLSSLLQQTDQVAAQMSAAVQQSGLTVSALTDVALERQGLTVASNLSAKLRGTALTSAKLESSLQQLGLTLNANLDSAVQAGRTTRARMDATLEQQRTVAALLTAALEASPEIAARMSVFLTDAPSFQVAALLDTLLQASPTLRVNLSAALRTSVTTTANMDAALLETLTTSALLSAALVQARSLTAKLDTALQDSLSVATNLDTFLAAAGATFVTAELDTLLLALGQLVQARMSVAIEQQDNTLAALLSVIVALAGTVAARVDVALQRTAVVRARLDATVQTSGLVLADMDTTVQRQLVVGALMDAFLAGGAQLVRARMDTAVQRSGATIGALLSVILTGLISGAESDRICAAGARGFVSAADSRTFTCSSGGRTFVA